MKLETETNRGPDTGGSHEVLIAGYRCTYPFKWTCKRCGKDGPRHPRTHHSELGQCQGSSTMGTPCGSREYHAIGSVIPGACK